MLVIQGKQLFARNMGCQFARLQIYDTDAESGLNTFEDLAFGPLSRAHTF